MQDIVLFGGTFDPVHHGHLIVARAVAECRGVGRVTLVPSGTPPHKHPARASAPQRLEMLRLAAEGEDWLQISDVEVSRAGLSYTLETLGTLARAHPDDRLHWIIGADMLADLPRWRRAKEVVEAAEILICVRPPLDQRLEAIFADLEAEFDGNVVERLRRNVVHTPLIDISSTDIRRRVAEGRSIRYLVPESVRKYITDQGLYR